MPRTISQRELRNDSGAIMRRVLAGESFTVTSNGTPVADLIPHDPVAAGVRRRFVPVASIAAGAATLPSWGIERFAAELTELDRFVDDSDRDPWDASGKR